MTAAPNSPLVEKVAKAIYQQDRMVVTGIFDGKLKSNKALSWEECKRHLPGAAKDAYDAAQAALDACHAEEMLGALRKAASRLAYQRKVGLSHQGDGELIAELDAILAKLGG